MIASTSKVPVLECANLVPYRSISDDTKFFGRQGIVSKVAESTDGGVLVVDTSGAGCVDLSRRAQAIDA